jgi:hypothetical protein
MAKFMLAHLQNGRLGSAQILKEETARLMHSQLYTPDPRLHDMAYGFFEDVVNGQTVISHGGDTILFHSELFLLPAQNIGVFVSTNSTGGVSLGGITLRAFLDHYYPVQKAADPLPASDFDTRAALYAGSYISSRSNMTSFEKIISALSPASVTVTDNKAVIISAGGQVNRFVEVEPGLLVSPEYPNRRVVMKTRDGQVSLYLSSPLVLIKAPWYASLGLHGLIFAGGALLFLLALLGWLKSFFAGLVKHEARPALSRLARLFASLFGLVFLIFFVTLIVVLTDNLPAYGVPAFFFETPAWFPLFMNLTLVAAVLGISMLPFAILAWVKRYWTVGGRLFYSLLTVFAFAILWSFTYWKFLL